MCAPYQLGMRAVAVAGVASAVFFAVVSARAEDKLASTLDVSLHETTSLLEGRPFAGPALRMGWSLEGLRFGGGAGASRSDGWSFSPTGTWALPLEAYAGFAFGEVRVLQGYVEMRAAATHVWGTPYRWTTELMPRAGLRVPLGEYFFADAGVGVGLFARETVALSLGIGLPIPTANL